MTEDPLRRLSGSQRRLLRGWMPHARALADHSWGLVDTVVLEISDGRRRAIVKAGGPDNHHLDRELDAHEGFTSVWTRTDSAPTLLHADRAERIAVLSYLPGTLAYRAPAATDPAVHRRAGELLRLFHSQASRAGGREAEERITRRTREWLDAEHRIAGDVEARLREALDALDPGDPPLVPTHGDWQPRNWLVDGDEVRVIDFGRFAFRAAATDLARLAAQEWRESPVCEETFLDGYGGDPRHPEHWLLVRLREAIGTAVWAFQVGDADFEAQGHRMIAEILEEL